MLAMLVARPMSVEPSSSSPVSDGWDSSPCTPVDTVALGELETGESTRLGRSPTLLGSSLGAVRVEG